MNTETTNVPSAYEILKNLQDIVMWQFCYGENIFTDPNNEHAKRERSRQVLKECAFKNYKLHSRKKFNEHLDETGINLGGSFLLGGRVVLLLEVCMDNNPENSNVNCPICGEFLIQLTTTPNYWPKHGGYCIYRNNPIIECNKCNQLTYVEMGSYAG